MKTLKLPVVLFIYFIASLSNSVFATRYDTSICIESKYVTRLCYQYRFHTEGENDIKTIICGYDQYDTLVIRVISSDSLAAEDADYTKKDNMSGARFVYDEKHRLIQEIWFHKDMTFHPMLIEYRYQIFHSERIRNAKVYSRNRYKQTNGFYVDKKEYEYGAIKRYIYKYYRSDEFSDKGFVILKCLDVDCARILRRKKLLRYEIRYPWQSMRCFDK